MTELPTKIVPLREELLVKAAEKAEASQRRLKELRDGTPVPIIDTDHVTELTAYTKVVYTKRVKMDALRLVERFPDLFNVKDAQAISYCYHTLRLEALAIAQDHIYHVAKGMPLLDVNDVIEKSTEDLSSRIEMAAMDRIAKTLEQQKFPKEKIDALNVGFCPPMVWMDHASDENTILNIFLDKMMLDEKRQAIEENRADTFDETCADIFKQHKDYIFSGQMHQTIREEAATFMRVLDSRTAYFYSQEDLEKLCYTFSQMLMEIEHGVSESALDKTIRETKNCPFKPSPRPVRTQDKLALEKSKAFQHMGKAMGLYPEETKDAWRTLYEYCYPESKLFSEKIPG